MNAHDRRRASSAAAPRRVGAATITSTTDPPGPGVEAYSYDPTLCLHEQTGLNRLRCIADREMAAVLYNIYAFAERNRARGGSTPAESRRHPRFRFSDPTQTPT